MNFLSSCLGLIVFRVCLSLASINAPPNLDTKRDYASIPGHLEPLGAKSVKHSLEVIQTYPDPKTFFKTHVVASKPVLIQNAAKLSSAFAKWTDEYFLSFPEATEHKIVAEQGKKEKRSLPSREISFSEFIKTYKEEDIYMVSSMPKFIRNDVLLPPPLLCRDITEKGILTSAVMWFSSGGTKSVLHMDDGLDNINCLFRGTKELLFIDYHKYKNVVPIDFPDGGYSGVDVDRVDFEKYPGLIDVEYYNVTMQAGDCLFIPQRWFHQVRSYGRNIAVNLWWQHNPGFVPEDCDGMEPNQTLDKFNFQPIREIVEKRELLNQLHRFLGKKNKISYRAFVKRLKKDPQVFNNEEIWWTDEIKLTVRKMFKLMDMDGDEQFSRDDLANLDKGDHENIKAITKEYYRLMDLLELERDDYTEEKSEKDAENDDTDVEDGDHDIQPVKKPAEEKAREEL